MENEKAFVHENGTAIISCPECKTMRRVDMCRYKKLEKVVRLRCRCRCGERFTVTLERRQASRKKVFLPGIYLRKNGERSQEHVIRVENISASGLCFSLGRRSGCQVGDSGVVKFHLDDDLHTLIKKTVTIRSVSGMNMGAEFCCADYENIRDKFLESYILSKSAGRNPGS